MASLPHTPPSSAPATSYSHLGPVISGSSREAGARFTSRSTTPIPSAVQHSFRPVRDIVSGSGFHDQSQRDSAPLNERNLEEVEYSPPGAFPGAEEAREPDAGEQAALGGYVGDKQDENHSHNNHATSGESSTLPPEEREPSPGVQSSSTSVTDSSHDTDSFRDPECAHASQSDIHQGNSESDVSGMRMSSTESFPTTTRPSGYTDEPSAWSSPYADTFVPPMRTYDVVREHLADQSQDISSGFGGRIDTVSPLEPITAARAVPSIAEPPLVVYSKTSTSTYVPTRDETRQTEVKSSEASVQDVSSHGTPDDEQSANRDVGAEERGGEELPRESNAEVEEKSKGLFSRLGNFVHGIYAGKRSKEESATTHPDSSQPTADESAGVQSNPSDSPAEPPVKKSWFGRAASSLVGGHSESTGSRRHTHPDIVPRNVPEHFDETIGPLPQHVELRGKGEFPTKEKPSGSRVGVGSLPGRRDEAGVARLPDERSGIIAAPQSRAYDEQDSQTMDREDERDVGAEGPSTSQAPQRSSPTHSSASSASSEGAEQATEPRSGLLSGLICDVEEILQDLGGVALYYVPGYEYLSKSDPKVDLPAKSQPIDTTQESKAESSASPSPVAAASPTRAPPSSPLVGIQTDQRQTSVEGTNSGCESSRSAATTPTTPPLVTDSRPFSTQFSASVQSDRLATPMDPSGHPSRSSSAEEVNHEVFIVGPPSTRERISGKQERVASALQREYVKSPTFEEHAAAGAAGSLPWYPTETGLRALISERMHDDQMRAAGAAEPEEATTSVLTNTREVPKEESTTNEAPFENKLPARSQTLPLYPVLVPPPIRVTTHDNVELTAKGFDIKSLGPPVAEGQQGGKKPSEIFAEQRRKSHN